VCRWARDLSQQLPRTEVTRFPHAVLDIQMDAEATHHPPKWLQVGAASLSFVVLSLGSFII
jgi:SPX domain protein involved in polyphosphate accumulation